jgi:EPS-associated MarR family transcriptional regulator
MNNHPQEIHYRLLKILSNNNKITQREIAKEMGISLGKVNYCLSELAKKGFVKIKRFKDVKNKLRYLYTLTPNGLEAKAQITLSFLKQKIVEYEEIKQQIDDLSREVEEQKFR